MPTPVAAVVCGETLAGQGEPSLFMSDSTPLSVDSIPLSSEDAGEEPESGDPIRLSRQAEQPSAMSAAAPTAAAILAALT
ncbi:hypothetical protein AB0C38_08880 [Amycolatopsis sp. NPDC048633]|uniref:hypothetical protein n=1 Tax=Amycolatopsis sp. NPDC048633 TaxID=3157095 RepID=UPI0033C0F624